MEKKEFIKGWRNFCDCINFGSSALDSEAIRFMNEFVLNLDKVIEHEKKND